MDGIKDWMGMLFEEMARLLVGFAGTIALNVALLAGASYAWGLYSNTGTGEKFIEMSPALSSHIAYIVSQAKLEYALDVTLIATVLILPVALLLHFVLIRQYLYASMPIFVKVAWIILAAYFVADVLQVRLNIESWGVAYASALPATLCLIPLCFTVAEHVIPNIATVLVRVKERF